MHYTLASNSFKQSGSSTTFLAMAIASVEMLCAWHNYQHYARKGLWACQLFAAGQQPVFQAPQSCVSHLTQKSDIIFSLPFQKIFIFKKFHNMMKINKYQAVNTVQNIKNKYVIYATRIKELPFNCSINN